MPAFPNISGTLVGKKFHRDLVEIAVRKMETKSLIHMNKRGQLQKIF